MGLRITKEKTTALAILEEEHKLLSNLQYDSNACSFGSINIHHIVIACLSFRKIGITSAAVAVTIIVRTFPSIRFGLMFDIGSGIPFKVKLGDVVLGALGTGAPVRTAKMPSGRYRLIMRKCVIQNQFFFEK